MLPYFLNLLFFFTWDKVNVKIHSCSYAAHKQNTFFQIFLNVSIFWKHSYCVCDIKYKNLRFIIRSILSPPFCRWEIFICIILFFLVFLFIFMWFSLPPQEIKIIFQKVLLSEVMFYKCNHKENAFFCSFFFIVIQFTFSMIWKVFIFFIICKPIFLN